ncbi:MAG: cell envelope biogenesis protein OmpA [Flavobacteriales bacterium]|nr:cell envelope biogenesis protein OmpA [Flavobacteriales bacterium]
MKIRFVNLNKFICMRNPGCSIFLIILLIVFLNSCVSPKVHNSLTSDLEITKNKLLENEKNMIKLKDDILELTNAKYRVSQKLDQLKNDSIQNGTALNDIMNKHKKLSESYDLLSNQSSRKMAEKAKEVKRLLDQLEESQNSLLLKEDELNKLSRSISQQKQELENFEQELTNRSNRVVELETIILQKDSIVSNMKNRISNSLKGLEGEGLSIEKRNGKIYVSLDEELLFASGKYEVNQTGIIALDKLSAVLASQNRIEILVEGHTDNIPLSTKKIIKDNWDLSVLRATAVVKILLKNDKLNPIQLTAAGRGEYNPKANNKTIEGRKMNRRIELILSPNLDDLYRILEE